MTTSPSSADAKPQPESPAEAPHRIGLRQRAVYRWSVPAIFVLLLAAAVEIVARRSLPEAIGWIIAQPIAAGMNLLLVVSIVLLLSSLLGRRIGGIAALLFCVFLGVVQATKSYVLNAPLQPWDFLLSRNAMNVFGGGYFPFDAAELGVFASFVLVLAGMALLMPKSRRRWWTRAMLGVLAGAMLASVAFCRYAPGNWMFNPLKQTGAVYDNVSDQPACYSRNGFLLSFTMNIQSAWIPQPAGYSPNQMRQLVEKLERLHPPQPPATSPSSPAGPVNVIIVLVESFWDPTLLKVSFDQDLLANFNRAAKQGSQFTVISPVFGGLTCNTEFEIATGFPMTMLPRSSVPYAQHIFGPTPSMASLLKGRGYRTLVLHPYFKWFWRREQVVPLLGFDQFVGLEDFRHRKEHGYFVSDESVAKEIIDRADGCPDPFFMFAITMQNHGPYAAGRYKRTEVGVLGDMPDAGKECLSTYAQGVLDADRSLGMLMDHFSKSARPTLIVFLGDHLPYLGPDMGLYRQCGMIPASGALNLDQACRMRRVPAVMWANYDMPRFGGEISMFHLPAVVLAQMGQPLSLYYRFLTDLRGRLPVLNDGFQADATGKVIGSSAAPSNESLKTLWLIQYNAMFGGQYYKDRLFN